MALTAWAEHFEIAGMPNPAVWGHENGKGGGSQNQLQRYQAQNSEVSNGRLLITAKKESVFDAAYTSSRWTTLGKLGFRYGIFSIRCSAPIGQGLVAACWFLPENWHWADNPWPHPSNEIDLFELVGNAPLICYSTLITGAKDVPTRTFTKKSAVLLTKSISELHDFDLIREPGKITWRVDGKTVKVETKDNWGGLWNLDVFMHIRLDLAVGGVVAGQVDDTVLPALYSIEGCQILTDDELHLAPGVPTIPAPGPLPPPEPEPEPTPMPPPEESPTLTVTAPQEGAIVLNPVALEVQTNIPSFQQGPGKYHLHVQTDLGRLAHVYRTPFKLSTVDIPPGEHAISVQLVVWQDDGQHVPVLDPIQRRFTIADTAPMPDPKRAAIEKLKVAGNLTDEEVLALFGEH